MALRSASVGIIGMGYVGLPLAIHAAGSGFRVCGYDTDPGREDVAAACETLLPDAGVPPLNGLIESGRLAASTSESILAGCDIFIICVPTPLTSNRVPEMRHVREAAAVVASLMSPGSLIVLESTTYPGCTREELMPVLTQTGLEPGRDFWLAFSPERVNPGAGWRQIAVTPKLVGGITEECTAMASLFYGQFIEQVVPVSGAETAEMAKLLENVYRSVNIALVNELAVICNRMGISVWETIDAAATKPFGFTPFYPGPGLGGHCIPIDPFYLAWKASELGLATEFVELAGKINTNMPQYVLERISVALNSSSKSLRGSSILLLGAAYKADVADLRESPAIEIAELLIKNGAKVSFHDPHVQSFHAGGEILTSRPLDLDTVTGADCVVVLTAHSVVDYTEVGRCARLVVDTRNVVPAANGKVFSI